MVLTILFSNSKISSYNFVVLQWCIYNTTLLPVTGDLACYYILIITLRTTATIIGVYTAFKANDFMFGGRLQEVEFLNYMGVLFLLF